PEQRLFAPLTRCSCTMGSWVLSTAESPGRSKVAPFVLLPGRPSGGCRRPHAHRRRGGARPRPAGRVHGSVARARVEARLAAHLGEGRASSLPVSKPRGGRGGSRRAA